MLDSDDFDFSFSGLKTAVFKKAKAIKQFNNITIANICASVQQAIIDVLITKTLKAAQKYKAKSILLGGGVAANQKLRNGLKLNAKRYTLYAKIFAPQKSLCTDNAAMIATAAFFNYKPIPWNRITANPELYL
jgi:N6-L-threonylcarbamoyladenine synthase